MRRSFGPRFRFCAPRFVLLAFANACAEPPASTEPTSQATLVIAQSEEAPVSLTIDDRFVYWVAGSSLRRAPLDGGGAETLATVSAVGSLAAVGGAVFVTERSAGTVVRIDRDGHKRVLGHGEQPEGLAVRDSQVFWTNSGMTSGENPDGSIATASVDGDGARVLLEGLNQPTGIAVDAEHIYFSSASQGCEGRTPPASAATVCWGGGVHALPREGDAPFVIDSQNTPRDLVLGPQEVFWMAEYPTRLMSAPLAGGGPTRVRVQSFEERPGPLAIDHTAVYFSSSERGRVMKLAFDASALTPIAVDLGSVGEIAVDARGVYVAATSQGRILRFPKDGSAARAEDPVDGPCPTPLGTAEEIASTPREDAKLELLALHLDSERVVASQETYERVVSDMRAIRALDPERADIDYAARDDAKTLLLALNDLAYQSVEADQYTAWDCLNTFYGLSRKHAMSALGLDTVLLELKGNYNLTLLSELYGRLPGVTSVEPNSSNNTSSICARRVDEQIDYVLDRPSGDCLAGCTEHHAKHFVSTAPGVVDERETFDSTTTAARPAWFSQICAQR